MTGNVKRYKFQALVTLHREDDGDPSARLGAAPRRMILRGGTSNPDVARCSAP